MHLKNWTVKRIALIVMLMAIGFVAMAQKSTAAPQKTRVLLVLDCSQSMWDKWQSDSKIKVTQKVLLRLLDSIQSRTDVEVALRVFGHLNEHAYGTNLEVPFEKGNIYKLQSKIKTLVPNGGCTAATALSKSLNDFPKDAKSRNIILVITDHITDPDGDIVEVTERIQESGNVVRTEFIGIGDKKNFQNTDDLTDSQCAEGHEQQPDQQCQILSYQCLIHNPAGDDGREQSYRCGQQDCHEYKQKLNPVRF